MFFFFSFIHTFFTLPTIEIDKKLMAHPIVQVDLDETLFTNNIFFSSNRYN